MQRLGSLVELLGPGWADVAGSGDYTKAALAVLERWGGPRALKKAGLKRVAALLAKTSMGHFGEDKADQLLLAADETITLWEASGGPGFAELAEDIAAEVRIIRALDLELAAIEKRVEALYREADPTGIVVSAPGLVTTLAAGILGRTGDLNRFANLSGVRAFTGLVPKVDQSGLGDNSRGPTKTGDPGLRQALYLAADHARKVDPTLAERYHRLVVHQGKHQGSALCSIAPVLMSRIAACWRAGTGYELRDTDGRAVTEAEGRAICAERYKVPPELRAKRRRASAAKALQRAGGPAQEGVGRGRSGIRPVRSQS
ncbi:MAG: transposase [Acidimicrobiales bacterium]